MPNEIYKATQEENFLEDFMAGKKEVTIPAEMPGPGGDWPSKEEKRANPNIYSVRRYVKMENGKPAIYDEVLEKYKYAGNENAPPIVGSVDKSRLTIQEAVERLESHLAKTKALIERNRARLEELGTELKIFEERVKAGYGGRYQEREEAEIKQEMEIVQKSSKNSQIEADEIEVALSKLSGS